MGLIDKIKNLFTEEIEEDTKPIKRSYSSRNTFT